MTASTAARHRTLKRKLIPFWDVQMPLAITPLWGTVGAVQKSRHVWQDTRKARSRPSWEAIHRGASLGTHFETKREAVQAVVDAEAGIGS